MACSFLFVMMTKQQMKQSEMNFDDFILLLIETANIWTECPQNDITRVELYTEV